jgi:hypothetical protein
MERIGELIADDPSQQTNLVQLRELFNSRSELLTQAIQLQRDGNREQALALIRTESGRARMDELRALISRMGYEEQQALSLLQTGLRARTHSLTTLLSALVCLNVLFALVVLYLLYRLSRVHPLVTVCAWSRTIEYEGEWLSFEEYLKRRFNVDVTHGISPAEMQNFMKARGGKEDSA